MTLRFGNSRETPRPESAAGMFESVVNSAANGTPLPGVLGVAQAVVAAWTSEMGGPAWLRPIRSSLTTAGILLAYRRSKDPRQTEEREDAYRRWASVEGVVPFDDLYSVRGLAFSALTRQGGFYDRKIAGSAYIVREFDCGLVVMFFDDTDLKEALTGAFAPSSVGVRPCDRDRALAAVRHAIWKQIGNAIDFTYQEDSYQDATYLLDAVAPCGDYIDRPANGHAEVLGALAARCSAFTRRGIRRRVLLRGAPGTGKSTLARRLAEDAGDGRVLRLNPDAVSRSSNNRIRDLVNLLQPTVLLMDDMDRADGASGLLNFIEESGLVSLIVATVNAVGRIDPALRRPGRFDEVIEIKAPDSDAWRLAILDHYFDVYSAPADVRSLAGHLSTAAAGLSPAELQELAKVLSVIGLDVLDVELERLREQAAYYTPEIIEAYLASKG